MNQSKILLILGIVAILGIGGVMYSKNSNMEEKSVTVEQSIPVEKSVEDEVKEVEIEAGSFYYKPNEIRVKKGQKIKVTIKSVSMMHDFNIDELGVKTPIIKDGDMGSVEFVADQVGEFEYYCSVGQHRQNGQVGKLIVE